MSGTAFYEDNVEERIRQVLVAAGIDPSAWRVFTGNGNAVSRTDKENDDK